jgi:hypothetical protein
MPRTISEHAPQHLAHGDRVTIRDAAGNELTGLIRRKEADNKLEVNYTMSAFGKEIQVATWKAGTGVRANGRWTSYHPVIDKQLSPF